MPGSDLQGLELHKLIKTFNDLVAVDEVSLTIEPGGVHGLLGPNGAGKTTILQLIMGILEQDRGELRFQGQPITSRQRRRFGYLPEERGLYQRTRVRETLIYLAQLQGLSHQAAASSIDGALERFELKTEGSKRIQMLSKGNQQKLQFIAAIAHEPSVLILDEPFAGLDPLNQVLFKELLVELQQLGATILLSTHQMDQAERLCQNITLLNHGRIILEGPLAEIKRSASKRVVEIIFVDSIPDGIDQWLNIIEIRDITVIGELKQDDLTAWNEIIAAGKIREFKIREPSLEDIFIEAVRGSTV
jgi:ABC-2 type transport system ATP-binding protein